CVGELNRRIDADDPRGPLERMGGPHQRLERFRTARARLQSDQTGGEGRGLALGLEPEQLHQGEAAEVVVHWPRLLSASKSRTSSSRPTHRPSQVKTAWLKLTNELASVEGTLLKRLGETRGTPSTSSAVNAQDSACLRITIIRGSRPEPKRAVPSPR